jgi:hypothetical protein
MIFDIPTKIIRTFEIKGERFAKGQLILIDKNFSTDLNYERPINLHQHFEWFIPVIVSNDEEPMRGDLVWNSQGVDILFINSDDLLEKAHNQKWKKILVLPENTLIETIRAIEAGFFKHLDSCLVAVEIHDEWLKENPPFSGPNHEEAYYKTKLSNSHHCATIERIAYTREDMIDKVLSYFDAFCKDYAKEGAIDPLKSIAWIDKNIY